MIFPFLTSVCCHSEERSDEESRIHPCGVFEILRFALNDNCILFLGIKKKLYLCTLLIKSDNSKLITHNSNYGSETKHPKGNT